MALYLGGNKATQGQFSPSCLEIATITRHLLAVFEPAMHNAWQFLSRSIDRSRRQP
tara:strand:+ start:229 stop:396 length:168 start_codon:yes stop_codon:yes gene_type:complete